MSIQYLFDKLWSLCNLLGGVTVKLLAQDPNDEPATELLKRIQAERNARQPVNHKRHKPA